MWNWWWCCGFHEDENLDESTVDEQQPTRREDHVDAPTDNEHLQEAVASTREIVTGDEEASSSEDVQVDETTALLFLNRVPTSDQGEMVGLSHHRIHKRVLSRIGRSNQKKQPISLEEQRRQERDRELNRRELHRQRMGRIKDEAERKEREFDEETRRRRWEAENGSV
ncbi:MAG: hypothetical protein Q9162_002182 [Coniocarpon cinnabarinum]